MSEPTGNQSHQGASDGRNVHIEVSQQVDAVEGGHVTGVSIGTVKGDVIHGNQTIIQQIVRQARERLSGSPYKFLSSYDLSDRDIFYGRDAVIEEIANQVPRHGVVIINGASGSGKTSLVNAGLLPRLAENGYTFIDFREYSDPLAQVRAYLTGQGLIAVSDEASLVEVMKAFQAGQETKLVVVFDQFERFLINVPPARRTAFIVALKDCIATFSSEAMNFVFVLRQEFLGQMLSEIEDVIPEAANEAFRYNLKVLSQDEAREAIIEPLKQIEAKIDYDDALVDGVLLAELEAQEGEQQGINPPHLQIVCHQLFEAAYKRYQDTDRVVLIDEAFYEALGGAASILTSYLDRTVEEIAAGPAKVAVVRSMLKAMVETTGTRRFVSVADLGGALPDVDEADIAKLLERLAERRVIEVRKPVYSLSHEYMVAQVQRWFDERELERKKARETLDRGVKAWQASQALLNERQVQHIRMWLVDLAEEEQGLLDRSHAKYTRDRRLKRIFQGAIVALAVVAGFSALLANQARNDAELRQGQAEGLISFMLGDLREKLEPLGRLEILNDVGDKAQEYFASIDVDALSEDELARQALALHQIGEVRIARDNLDSALVSFRQAMILTQSLAGKDPHNAERQFDLAQSHYWIGAVHYYQGDLDSAQAAFQAYYDIARQQVDARPEDSRWLLELSYAHNNLGAVLEEQDDYTGALEQVRQSVAINERLVTLDATERTWRTELADGYSWLGKILRRQGDQTGALVPYRKALGLLDDLIAEDPDHALLQELLAFTHISLAVVYEATTETDSTLVHYRAAQGLFVRLVAHDPANTVWQDGLADSHHGVGAALRRSGALVPALPALRTALAIRQKLVAQDSTHFVLRRDLALLHTDIGRVLEEQGALEAAFEAAQNAVALREDLLEEAPEDWASGFGLAHALVHWGRVQRRRGREAEAQAAWIRVVELCDTLTRQTEDARVLAHWAEAALLLGRLEDARPLVERLVVLAYNDPAFWTLCRQNGLPVGGEGV